MQIGHRLAAVAVQVRRRYWGTDRAAEYARLLREAREAGYEMVTLRDFAARTAAPDVPRAHLVALRHDVDICDAGGNEAFYKLELAAGARSTFYFRWSTAAHHRKLIRSLLADGFEVGYHYEETATVIKRSVLGSREEVDAHREAIGELMRERCAEFRRRWNPDLVSAASHGDWANRLVGVANHELVTPELLASCGLDFEAYGETILGRSDIYVSDVAAPSALWARDVGLDAAVKAGNTWICMLTHERRWHVNRRAALRADLGRVWDEASFRVRRGLARRSRATSAQDRA